MFNDPLRIYYFLIMDDDELVDMSPFQGFGRSWGPLQWAMWKLAPLPGDVTERSHSPEQIAVQRIAGMRPLMWMPLFVSALEAFPEDRLPPCAVVFTGIRKVADRVEKFIARNRDKILHVSSVKGRGIHAESFDVEVLRTFCVERLRAERGRLNVLQQSLVATIPNSWELPEIKFENFEVKGHNVSSPNHMALQRLGYTLNEPEPFVGYSEAEYTDAVLQSAIAVAFIRYKIGQHDVYAIGAEPPGVILFEPALFRHVYRRHATGKDPMRIAVERVSRFFRQQKGLYVRATPEKVAQLSSNEARFVTFLRAEELRTQTLGVGLFAAQTTSPVIRLTPAVNQVFAALSSYARSVRAARPEGKRKASRLFSDIQKQLKLALGQERIEFISKTSGPVKIISDAPIEWLSTEGLPLSFQRDCSRIPVTPGNLMMGQLVPDQPMSIPPEALRKVLIISAFKPDDPLKNVLSHALELYRPNWEGIVEVTQVHLSTVEEFKKALNEFDGEILIFDGHGIPNDSSPVSKIAIGDAELDVWSLRAEVRCPPIVVLSACDTHGIDASSHATVGNGFLAIGARTVLGTFLPVDGIRSATFIARLLHRVAEFVPVAIKEYERSITWAEVMSGMLRMSLTTEVVFELFGIEDEATFRHLQNEANHDINTLDPAWFKKLVERIAKAKGVDRAAAEKLVQISIASSDAVRYTQLGNPETIVIDDGSIAEKIIEARESGRQIDTN